MLINKKREERLMMSRKNTKLVKTIIKATENAEKSGVKLVSVKVK